MAGIRAKNPAWALPKSSGHTYQNIHVSGNANVHFGDRIIKQEGVLDYLPSAAQVQFNSPRNHHEVECLTGTREAVLRQIETWVDDPSLGSIFWLNGSAGTGKSTIARTVARTYYKKEQLGASFFFSRSDTDASKATKFFTTIAAQLIETCPALKPAITNAVERNKNIANETLPDQWNELILKPLLSLDLETNAALVLPPVLVFVIDALDECDSDHTIVEILRLLAEAKPIVAFRFRVLITSRPEAAIFRGFRVMGDSMYESLALTDIPREIVDKDMSLFFQDRFKDIALGSENLLADWPGPAAVEFLVQKAAGLFIYAATVCRFIQRNDLWSPKQLLAIFVPDDQSKISRIRQRRVPSVSPTAELDAVYMTVLKQSMKGSATAQDDEDIALDFKLVIGSLVLLLEPLSTTSLANLLDFDQDTIHTRLSRLRSVLYVPDDPDLPINLLHPSFREFLTSRDRCHDPKYYVDPRSAQSLLGKHCLDRLMQEDISLKKDICNLKAPDALVEDIDPALVARYIPPDMQYACLYWVQHLGAGGATMPDNGQSREFLSKYLLYWLEALSLIRRFSVAVTAIIALDSSPQASQSPHMPAFIRDAKRFILHSRYIIEIAPLQTYCSALVFSPENSLVRAQYLHQIPPWIKALPMVQREWNGSLQVLEGHTSLVRSVKFSPDDHILASGCWDGTVKLWDAATGTLRFTLRGHSSLTGLTFSPKDKILASGDGDGTIKLWNPTDGTLSRTLTASSGVLLAVCFSPDGEILASASNNTITLWDTKSGVILRSLEGHTQSISSLSFSPTGQLLASGSGDKTVMLWNWATGTLHGSLKHESWIDDVAFSPVDGNILASACFDGTASLWDIEQGSRRHTLKHPDNYVSAVAISPDGTLLASGTYGNTVMLWDVVSGTSLAVLNGHRFYVYAVEFSPTGRLLASASGDNTVRLWDPMVRVDESASLDSHSGHVADVKFSPDGQIVASGSWDHTVKLWNPTIGKCLGTLTGHTNFIHSISFSPDGQLLASGSNDRTVKLWNVATMTESHTFLGHKAIVLSVSFSPTGHVLASAGNDSTVCLWNPTTKELLYTLQCYWSWTNVIAFSPDSRLVVAGSFDPGTASNGTARPSNIRLWDLQTGEKLQEFDAEGTVQKLSFDREGSSLRTNRGIIEFPLPVLCENPPGSPPAPSLIDATHDWITYDKEPILWLPSDYRTTCSSVNKDIIALGHASGKVTFVRLDEKEMPHKPVQLLSRNGLSTFPNISESIWRLKQQA